jgi:hypothetical protein
VHAAGEGEQVAYGVGGGAHARRRRGMVEVGEAYGLAGGQAHRGVVADDVEVVLQIVVQ